MVQVSANIDNHTIAQFNKLLDERMGYLGETADQSCTAVVIDALKSIRPQTKIAKLKKKMKIGELKHRGDLHVSFTSSNGKRVCIRNSGGNRVTSTENTKIVYIAPYTKAGSQIVVEWTDQSRGVNGKRYLIACLSKEQAENWAREKVEKRVRSKRGLARRAIGILMGKVANGKRPNDMTNSKIETISRQNTVVHRQQANNLYVLDCGDLLLYALDALKNGKQSLNLALRKATNKVVSTVNRKVKRLIGFSPLETPYPELTRRGRRQ